MAPKRSGNRLVWNDELGIFEPHPSSPPMTSQVVPLTMVQQAAGLRQPAPYLGIVARFLDDVLNEPPVRQTNQPPHGSGALQTYMDSLLGSIPTRPTIDVGTGPIVRLSPAVSPPRTSNREFTWLLSREIGDSGASTSRAHNAPEQEPEPVPQDGTHSDIGSAEIDQRSYAQQTWGQLLPIDSYTKEGTRPKGIFYQLPRREGDRVSGKLLIGFDDDRSGRVNHRVMGQTRAYGFYIVSGDRFGLADGRSLKFGGAFRETLARRIGRYQTHFQPSVNFPDRVHYVRAFETGKTDGRGNKSETELFEDRVKELAFAKGLTNNMKDEHIDIRKFDDLREIVEDVEKEFMLRPDGTSPYDARAGNRTQVRPTRRGVGQYPSRTTKRPRYYSEGRDTQNY